MGFNQPGSIESSTLMTNIGTSPDGTLVVGGLSSYKNSENKVIAGAPLFLRNYDGSWQPFDFYTSPEIIEGMYKNISVADRNKVFAGGWIQKASGAYSGFARLTEDGGASWKTVFEKWSPLEEFATVQAVDISGTRLYVCGDYRLNKDESHASVAVSEDNGASWKIILDVKSQGRFFAVETDANGHIYVLGRIADNLVLYKSTDGHTFSLFYSDTTSLGRTSGLGLDLATDGRILVTGAHFQPGATNAACIADIFDPKTVSWKRVFDTSKLSPADCSSFGASFSKVDSSYFISGTLQAATTSEVNSAFVLRGEDVSEPEFDEKFIGVLGTGAQAQRIVATHDGSVYYAGWMGQPKAYVGFVRKRD